MPRVKRYLRCGPRVENCRCENSMPRIARGIGVVFALTLAVSFSVNAEEAAHELVEARREYADARRELADAARELADAARKDSEMLEYAEIFEYSEDAERDLFDTVRKDADEMRELADELRELAIWLAFSEMQGYSTLPESSICSGFE